MALVALMVVRVRARTQGFNSSHAQTARFNIPILPTAPANQQFNLPCPAGGQPIEGYTCAPQGTTWEGKSS